MLIDIFHKNQPDKTKIEDEQILQAEVFIKNLRDKEKKLVKNHIDSLINQLVLEESFLYQHGFIDGLKLTKFIYEL